MPRQPNEPSEPSVPTLPPAAVDVRTTRGVVRGRHEAGLVVVRGVPFARIPARFGAPEPMTPWEGARPAVTFGPPPPQSAYLGTNDADDGSGDPATDWLTVNVWSPDLGGGLPVMVWIQGGGYGFGHAAQPEYDGSVLARSGVVVVTFNYRVGLEGFGFVPGSPANRGLLDQVSALRWVQENIAGFGGDPAGVTVFGQSAGAGSIACLLVMPQAAGLFRRAIVQSMPGTFFTAALAADLARACGAVLGLAPADLPTVDPQLLTLAADDVLAAMSRFGDRWGPAAHAQILFAPVVDGEVLPRSPWEGLTGVVDLVVGHTRDEQRLLTMLSGLAGTITAEQADRTADILTPDAAAYLAAFPDPEQRYEAVRSDWLFRMPSLHLARAQLAAGGRAYLYELTWPAPGLGGALGACHGLDIPLVFGTLDRGGPAQLIGGSNEDAVELSARMRGAWTAFAADGDPGWPSFDTGLVKVFDAVPAVGTYPEQVSSEIWPEPPAVLDLAPADTARREHHPHRQDC